MWMTEDQQVVLLTVSSALWHLPCCKQTFFLAVLGLRCCSSFSLLVASWATLQLQCTGFLLQWLLLLQSMGSRACRLSVAQSCPVLCDPMDCSTPGLPVHQQLPEFTQTHFHWIGDAIKPSHPLSSHFPPAPNPSQHQSLFQWVNSLHEVAKVLEFQL